VNMSSRASDARAASLRGGDRPKDQSQGPRVLNVNGRTSGASLMRLVSPPGAKRPRVAPETASTRKTSTPDKSDGNESARGSRWSRRSRLIWGRREIWEVPDRTDWFGKAAGGRVKKSGTPKTLPSDKSEVMLGGAWGRSARREGWMVRRHCRPINQRQRSRGERGNG
jgi:hypothetical protein